MSDLTFTEWSVSVKQNHWIRRMISANGTIDMFSWVSLYLDEKDQTWVVLFGDKLERFKDLYQETYGNRHKVSDITPAEIQSNIDTFLNYYFKEFTINVDKERRRNQKEIGILF